MLKDAQELLPKDIFFKIYSSYRSIKEQEKAWSEKIKETKEENPNITNEEELKRLTGLKLANPISGYGGHQTGAAVDITLCDIEGNEFNMGTKIGQHNNKTKTKNQNLSKEEKNNRKLLKKTLEKVGFNNYPIEWWHFSYGDQMWAAYKNTKECIYGLINKHEDE